MMSNTASNHDFRSKTCAAAARGPGSTFWLDLLTRRSFDRARLPGDDYRAGKTFTPLGARRARIELPPTWR
jgi:hypothetical protein